MAHRDIKPFNIFVTNKKLLLIDFGSAAAMGIRERMGLVRVYSFVRVSLWARAVPTPMLPLVRVKKNMLPLGLVGRVCVCVSLFAHDRF